MPTLELPALYVDPVVAVVVTTRPVVMNRNPGPGETGVPLSSVIALEVSDPGPDGIDRTATRVWVDGALAFEGGGLPEHKPGFDGPRAEVLETPDTLRIVLDPAVPFASQARVEVRVVSATQAGAHTLDTAYECFAEDRTAPRLLAAQATAQRALRLGFDEPVQVTDPTGFGFVALSSPAVPLAPVSATADSTTVTILLDTEMTPDVPYRVTAAGVSDLHGNPVLPPFDVAVFPGYRPPRPEGRRFDLWTMLPAHNRRDDATGDLGRFLACLQDPCDLLLAEIDRFPDLFDLERAPEPFLNAILLDLGNPFPFALDELGKRRLASVLVEMYRQKGTAQGIQNAIRFFLGIEVVTITLYAGTTLILGESELGVDWVLGPSDRFARYSFGLQVSVPLTETERRQIRAIVDYLKPAHTHFVELIEPLPPPVYHHWELGISELGETTDLH